MSGDDHTWKFIPNKKMFDINPITGEKFLVPLSIKPTKRTPQSIRKQSSIVLKPLDFNSLRIPDGATDSYRKPSNTKKVTTKSISRSLFPDPPPKIKVTRSTPIKKNASKMVPSTSGSKKPTLIRTEDIQITDSVKKFNQLERFCEDHYNTTQGSNKRTHPDSTSDLDLENTIRKIELFKEQEAENHKKFVEDQEIRHQLFVSLVNETLLDLKKKAQNVCSHKENQSPNRRSGRLKKRCQSGKRFVSFANLDATDLRKNTLIKNLPVTAVDNLTQSPRAQKALELYNSCSTLTSISETPVKQNGAINNNLRSTIRTQCLLLQDTPIRK